MKIKKAFSFEPHIWNNNIGYKYIQENEDQDVIVITKDINFRVKCDALGIEAEDYYKDRIVKETSEIFTGQLLINEFDPAIIDEFGASIIFFNPFTFIGFPVDQPIPIPKDHAYNDIF